MLKAKERERLSKLSSLIFLASKEIKILRHIAWDKKTRDIFFDKDCKELPVVEYSVFDNSDLKLILSDAKSYIGKTKYDYWLIKKIDDLKKSSELLKNCGTENFYKISSEIYGTPLSIIHDGSTRPIDLSKKFDDIINSIDNKKIDGMTSPKITDSVLQKKISKSVNKFFGSSSPEVKIVPQLSAKATATSKYIKIRQGGEFDESDINQLLNHEAYIHVATTLNGKAQSKMKILGSNFGSITKTQEGLAVFSEFITGSVDINRMRRISDRVIAIQMAIEGADFIQIFNYFLERHGSKGQAYESSRRIFRGGLLTGGAPFTKDIVYLDGFIRVYNFLRSAIASGKTECISLLFSGKLDLDDIPVIYSLYKEGLVTKPLFIPNWAKDLNFLICYLSFSVFLEKINYDNVSSYYDKLLGDIE